MSNQGAISGIFNLTVRISRGWETGSALIALLATLRVFAATLVVFPVAQDSLTEAELGRLTYAAELSASRTGRWEVKPLCDALDPENAQRRAQAIKEAESAFKLGQKSYDELDARRAFAEFERAAQNYEQADLSGIAFVRLTSAWTMKIASLIASGDHKQGQAEIEKLLGVMPEARFVPNFFPPDDIAYAEKARARIATGKVSISVSTNVSSSVVSLDGRYLGKAPIELDAAKGEHYLTVQTPGFSLSQHRIRAGKIEFVPEPAARTPHWLDAGKKIAKTSDRSGRHAIAAEFGRLVQADQVLLLVAKANGQGAVTLTAVRLEATDGRNWVEGSESFAVDSQLEQRVENWLSDLLGRDEPRPSRSSAGSTWAERNVGYIVLGGAAALLAGGIFLGIHASRESSTFRSLPQTDPNAGAVRSSGRTYAIAADLMFIGALVAGGTGAYFTLFQPSHTSE